MKTFFLYWFNNPNFQTVRGYTVTDAVRSAGISDETLNSRLTGFSETQHGMEWDNSDCGGWVPLRR